MKHTWLFTIGLALLGASTLSAQRGGGITGRSPSPSSTALGAGALSAFPSATSRSSAPGFARQYAPSSGYLGSRSSLRTRTSTRTTYGQPRNYVAAPYWLPLFLGSDYSAYPAAAAPEDYGPDYGTDPTDALIAGQAALGQQVQRLTVQMNDLMYGPPYQQQAPVAQQPAPPSVPLTLVLRDGQQLQVQNYAVTDNMFWEFTDRSTRKIPLSNIDLAASAKATQANGGEFPQIGATQ